MDQCWVMGNNTQLPIIISSLTYAIKFHHMGGHVAQKSHLAVDYFDLTVRKCFNIEKSILSRNAKIVSSK